MSTAERVLERARSQIGVTEAPHGSNHTPYCDWYGLSGPWCAMFVSWCFFHETLPLPATTSRGFAYCPSGADWFRRQGRWSDTPQVGAVVFFDFPHDNVRRISHVGIVESVRPDGTVVTIEGNTDERGGRTGGKVMRRARRTGIIGYGLPAFPSGPGPGPSPQRPAGGRPPFPGTTRQGSSGHVVRQVQERLLALGSRIEVDGEFGPQTAGAVRSFQQSRGLEVDGIVGPRTWEALWS